MAVATRLLSSNDLWYFLCRSGQWRVVLTHPTWRGLGCGHCSVNTCIPMCQHLLQEFGMGLWIKNSKICALMEMHSRCLMPLTCVRAETSCPDTQPGRGSLAAWLWIAVTSLEKDRFVSYLTPSWKARLLAHILILSFQVVWKWFFRTNSTCLIQ